MDGIVLVLVSTVLTEPLICRGQPKLICKYKLRPVLEGLAVAVEFAVSGIVSIRESNLQTL